MKANQSTTASEALELLISRVSLHSAAVPFWQVTAENHVRHCRNAEELYSLLLVKFVSSVIGKSIELADGRHEAGGIAIEKEWTRDQKHAAILAAPKSRTGRGKKATLSHTDREEISSEVSRVLSYQDAWQRPLQSSDWNLCFSRVQSVDCLELNRRHKRLENFTQEELTLENLASPTCDIETDSARLELLASTKAKTLEWLEAAAKLDSSRKAKSNLQFWKNYLEAVCDGTAGNGKDKRERRRDRAKFREYVAIGQKAVKAQSLRKGDYLPASLALDTLALV